MGQLAAAVARGERRYPGVAFFRDQDIDRSLFFGRERPAYDLLHLVLAERLVVLLARSGIGKSSLINAGLMQPLREAECFPMVVRINSTRDNALASLYSGVKVASERGVADGVIDSYEPADPEDWNTRSLWHFMKTFCLWRGDKLLQPVLILDQFEELFTLISAASRKKFVDQLADLVRGTRPRKVGVTRDDGELSDRPPRVRVLLAIREDFLAHLDEMAGRIPSILRARYRLSPLREEEARLAITKPATVDSRELATQPFEWADDAVARVLRFLRGPRSRAADGTEFSDDVEPFQLQLICQHVEELVAQGALKTIRLEHLGGENVDATMRAILVRFYDRCLATVRREFQPVRLRRLPLERLCEQEFISAGGRRRFCEESRILKGYAVPPDVLGALVTQRLIRKEERVGDSYYELTHDTLIAPILERRRRRSLRRRWRRGLLVGAVLVGLTVIQIMPDAQSARAALVNQPDVVATSRVRAAIGVGDTIYDRLGVFERAGVVVLDTFTIAVATNVSMRIDVSSDEIDTYLLVQTSNGKVLADDDSGGGLTDSSLTVSAEDPVRVIVTSFRGGETGSYRLSVTKIPPELVVQDGGHGLERDPAIIDEAPARELSVPADVTATLDEEFRRWRLDAWLLRLSEAQLLRVELSSEAFDPYLVVQTPAGEVIVNDDSGGGLNSSLEVPISVAGTVRIMATSYSGSADGEYRLSVDRID